MFRHDERSIDSQHIGGMFNSQYHYAKQHEMTMKAFQLQREMYDRSIAPCKYCGRTKQNHKHKQCDGCGASKRN